MQVPGLAGRRLQHVGSRISIGTRSPAVEVEHNRQVHFGTCVGRLCGLFLSALKPPRRALDSIPGSRYRQPIVLRQAAATCLGLFAGGRATADSSRQAQSLESPARRRPAGARVAVPTPEIDSRAPVPGRRGRSIACSTARRAGRCIQSPVDARGARARASHALTLIPT